MSKNNCCVVGCSNTRKKSPGTHFYTFPVLFHERERRRRWIAAVRRRREDGSPWEPTKNSRICSQHFINGERSNDPRSPAYVPTIFPSVRGTSKRYQRLRARDQKVDSITDAPALEDAMVDCTSEEENISNMSVQVKVEPSSPPSLLPSGMMGIDFKVEPSSPEPMLPLEVIGVDIKIEASSPPSTPSPDHLDKDTKGPFEPPVPLPTIDSVTTLANNTEDSASTAAMDSDKRTSKGATVSPPKRRIECKMCGQCFATTETLRNHWNVHTGERPYACPVCDLKFARKATLEQHKRTHTGEKPYLCSICGRGFSQTSSLATHRFTHTDERAHACLICGQKFANKTRLARHERGHTGEMPYMCQMCPSKFCKKESFDRHVQLHASGVEMWHCLECGKNFTKLTALLTHLKWHKMNKPHPCHLCPARFEKKCYLEIHMLTHTGEKPHKCPVCERHFARPSEVRRHTRSIHDRAKITTASSVSKAEEITLPSNTLTLLHPEDADMNEKGPAEAAVDKPAALKHCEASQQPRMTSVVFSETQLTGTPVCKGTVVTFIHQKVT